MAGIVTAQGCPFYGASLVLLSLVGQIPCVGDVEQSPHLIVNRSSNRCALVTSAHSPCVMKISGQEPAWAACARNPENNGSYRSPVPEHRG